MYFVSIAWSSGPYPCRLYPSNSIFQILNGRAGKERTLCWRTLTHRQSNRYGIELHGVEPSGICAHQKSWNKRIIISCPRHLDIVRICIHNAYLQSPTQYSCCYSRQTHCLIFDFQSINFKYISRLDLMFLVLRNPAYGLNMDIQSFSFVQLI